MFLWYDMKDYADRGGCYPPKPSASADNTLRDLHNSLYHTEVNNCLIIHSNYFQSSKNTKCRKMHLNGSSLLRRIFAKQWPIPPLSLVFGRFSPEDKH